MPRKTTPSFILELPLKTSTSDERALEVRLEAARHLYNACLDEGLKRLDLAHQSRDWRSARRIKHKDERACAFRAVLARVQFSESALQAHATACKNACWMGDHLDAHVTQKMATRAFQALEQYGFGKRGRPRFKRRGTVHSVEGKSNDAGIRWRDGRVLWKGLELSPCFDKQDKEGVQSYGLNQRTKYVRLLRRTIRGRTRWYVQLIQEGVPHEKPRNRPADVQAEVALDVGPSTVAMVSQTEARLASFCGELKTPQQAIRCLSRALDRSRRATNPDNYHPDGTIKKGKKRWKRSRGYERIQKKLAEMQRKLAATRKRLHGQMANEVIRQGGQIKAEKLSYKAFQRLFGKSVGLRAPGAFMAMVRRKAKAVGGSLMEFSPYHTKLSQLCHGCGGYLKKPLAERWHHCDCGVGPVQRDLYSAWLALFVQADQTLAMRQAQQAWPGAEPRLERAMISVLNQAAKGGHCPASFGVSRLRRQSGSPVKSSMPSAETVNGVGTVRAPLSESHGEVGIGTQADSLAANPGALPNPPKASTVPCIEESSLL